MGPGGLVSGHPSRLQKRIFGQKVGGVDLLGLMPGFQVAGIGIDNPSGSWLLVAPLNQFVPPYTMAWASPIDPPNITVEVSYPATGPGGLLSTNAGAPAVVTLYGYSVAASGGYPYIGSQQPPQLIVSGFASYAPATILACPAGQRIRLYTITLDVSAIIAPYLTTGAQFATLEPLTGGVGFGAGTALTQFAGAMEPVPPVYLATVSYLPFGLDGPVGANLNGKITPRLVTGGSLFLGCIMEAYCTVI